MRHIKPVLSPLAWLFSPLSIALLASQSALGLQYIVVQPIDVCATAGASGGCAPFNNLTKSPNPATATPTTPIGWVDTTTNMNLTRAIWLQAGIDVTFLPIVQYNNSNYQNIEVDCSTVTNPCSGTLTSSGSQATPPAFFGLKPLSDGTAAAASGCISNCKVPVGANAPFPNANAMSMFFVNTLTPGAGVGSPLYGFGWLNGNGIAVAGGTFFPALGQTQHTDTLAHEIGHNLSLDHNTFGAPQPPANNVGTACPPGVLPSPGGCNLMDAGSVRISPKVPGCTAQSTTGSPPANNGGTLYDLDTGLCGITQPGYPIADYLIPDMQIPQALKSGFLNSVANVNATAGGGIPDASINGAAVAASTNCVPTGKAQCFTVSYPNDGSGRSGGFIVALIVAVPDGYKFGGNAFTYVSGVKPKSAQQINGNSGGGNSNCQKTVPISGKPGEQCEEIDFAVNNISPRPLSCGPSNPQACYVGDFSANTSITFMLNIMNTTTGQPATLDELTCDTPMAQGCLTITPVFGDLFAITFDFNSSGFASASSVDTTVISQIIDPANFPTIHNLNPPLIFIGSTQTPCTSEGDCPPLAGGEPNEGG